MSWLENYFDQLGPGAAVAVVPDDGPSKVACIGRADLSADTAIHDRTPFELASASKWFTATLVMKLVEDGELDLDDPIHRWFPAAKHRETSNAVRLIDLLGHTSNLPDYLAEGMHTAPTHRTISHVRDRLPAWWRTTRPRAPFAYSNTNYVVLAEIVSLVAGAPFALVADAQLFSPLRMQDTVWDPTGRTISNQTRGYQRTTVGIPGFAEVPPAPIDTVGDGGLISTLEDLIRWQRAFWRGEIVTAESIRQMTTPSRPFATGELESGYGLGLQIEASPTDTWIGHAGSWTSATTCLGRYPDRELSVVVLSNEFMGPVERIMQTAAQGGMG